MKTRALLAVLAVAGTAAAVSAQPSVTLTWNWVNLRTNTQVALEPNDSAAVWVNLAYTPVVGQALPNGNINQGLASLFVDLHAEGSGNANAGDWFYTGFHPTTAFPGTPEIQGFGTNVPQGYTGPGSMPLNPLHWGRRNDWFHGGWALGDAAIYQAAGSAKNNPHTLAAIQAGQFPTGTTGNAFNPLNELWRGMFTPADYSDRNIVWQPRTAEASLTSGISFYGLPPGGSALVPFVVPIENINWGSLSIPVIPSPSSLALLGLGGLIAARRRR
jgi:hypothetical protein